MGYMLKQASDLLIKDLENFRDVLRRRAVEFKYTPCIGRTHGIHAEATTFGLKLCNWLAETERNIERMKRAKRQSPLVKFPVLLVRMPISTPLWNNMYASILALKHRLFRRRHYSVTAMLNS